MSAPMPVEYWRWRLIRETGWTVEQVDALSMGDWQEYMQIIDAEAKARKR